MNEHKKDVKWEGWYNVGMVGLEVQRPFSRMLVNGSKSMEVRKYPLPQPLVNKRVLILESDPPVPGADPTISSLGDILDGGQVCVVGWCVFERVMNLKSRAAFLASEDKHLVPRDSKLGWTDDTEICYAWIVEEYGEFSENENPPPIVDKIIRRMRSLFEVLLSGSQMESNATVTRPRIENGSPLKVISDVIMVSDVIPVRSVEMSPDSRARQRKMRSDKNDKGALPDNKDQGKVTIPRSSEMFDPSNVSKRKSACGNGKANLEAALEDAHANIVSLTNTNRLLSRQLTQMQEDARNHLQQIQALVHSEKVLNEKIKSCEEQIRQERVSFERDREQWRFEKVNLLKEKSLETMCGP